MNQRNSLANIAFKPQGNGGREPMMAMQIERLAKECNRLQEIADRLVERLSVVSQQLIPDPPTGNEPCVPTPFMPQVVQSVANRVEEIARVANKLEDAFDRLEV